MKKLLFVLGIFLVISMVSCKKDEETKITESDVCESIVRSYPITITGIEGAREHCVNVRFEDSSLELKRNEYLFIGDVYGALKSINSAVGVISNQINFQSPQDFRESLDVSGNGIKGILSGAFTDILLNMEDAFKRLEVITSHAPEEVTMEVSGVSVAIKGSSLDTVFPGLVTDTAVIGLDGIWGMPEVYFWGALFSGVYGLWDALISQDLGVAADWLVISQYVNDELNEPDNYLPWTPHILAHILGNFPNLFTWDDTDHGKEFYLKSRIYFAGALAYLVGSDEEVRFPDSATFVAPAGEGLIPMLSGRMVKDGEESPYYLTIIDGNGDDQLSVGDLLSLKGVVNAYRLANSGYDGVLINPFSPDTWKRLIVEGRKIVHQLLNYEDSTPEVDLGILFSEAVTSIAKFSTFSGEIPQWKFPDNFAMVDFGALYRVTDNPDFKGFRSFLPAWIYNGGATREIENLMRADLDGHGKPFDYLLMWEYEFRLGSLNFITTMGVGNDGPYLAYARSYYYGDFSHFDTFMSGVGKINEAFVGKIASATDALTGNLVILPPDNLMPPDPSNDYTMLMYFNWQEPTLWGFLKVDSSLFPDNCKPDFGTTTDEVVKKQIEINGVLNCALINYFDILKHIWLYGVDLVK